MSCIAKVLTLLEVQCTSQISEAKKFLRCLLYERHSLKSVDIHVSAVHKILLNILHYYLYKIYLYSGDASCWHARETTFWCSLISLLIRSRAMNELERFCGQMQDKSIFKYLSKHKIAEYRQQKTSFIL